MLFEFHAGALAQLGECYTGSVEVSGSNPLCSTIYFEIRKIPCHSNHQNNFPVRNLFRRLNG